MRSKSTAEKHSAKGPMPTKTLLPPMIRDRIDDKNSLQKSWWSVTW